MSTDATEMDGSETESSQLQPQDRFASSDVTPKKMSKRTTSIGMGLSPSNAKRLRCDEKCKHCEKSFDNVILWRIHKNKRCGEKFEATVGPLPEVIDFTKLQQFKDCEIEIVAYIKEIQPAQRVAEGHFRFRVTFTDKNGKGVYGYWNVKEGMKEVGIESRVSQKTIDVVAAENLYNCLLQGMLVGPLRVRKHSFKSMYGEYNLGFTEKTRFLPCSEEAGDFERLNPRSSHWGIPSCPLSAIDSNLNTMINKQSYSVIGFVESIQKSDKKYKKNWHGKETATMRVFGKLLLYVGVDGIGKNLFKSMRWTCFLQVSPVRKAPWPTFLSSGPFNFAHVRNKTVVFKARYDDGIRDDTDYGPSLTIVNTVEMVDVLKIKVSLSFFRRNYRVN